MNRRTRNSWIETILLAVLVTAAAAGCGGGGGGSSSPVAPTDTTAPTAPAALTAVAASDSAINLAWTASTDNVGVTGYVVYRGASQIATPTGTSYSDTGLSSSTTYTYTVKAKDAAGNLSSPSPSASAKTLASGATDTQAPSVPSNLVSTATGSTSISLTWTASTDNVGVLGYNIYSAQTSTATPVKVGTSSIPSFNHTGLTASTTYYYTVTAYDAANNESAPSNQSSATTAAAITKTLRVRVLNDYAGNAPLAGVTVVLGNSSGALVSSLTTDVNGEVTFVDPPTNATVTTAVTGTSPWSPTETLYSLHAFYDVNVSAFTISLTKTVAGTQTGTANISINNSIAAVTNWDVWPGTVFGSSTSNPVAVSIYPADFQTDGKVSFVALGYDVTNAIAGFGTLADQDFTDGMGATINLNSTAFQTVTTSFSNVPSTAKGIDWIDVGMSRKGGEPVYFADNTITPMPASYSFSVVPGYGDHFIYDHEIVLDTDSNGSADGYRGSWKQDTTLASQTVDYSNYPSVPTSISLTGTGTARPTVSWTGSDPAADEIWMEMHYYDGVNGKEYFYALEAPVTRTNVQFPELPAPLAAFAPTAWTPASIGVRVENDDFVSITGYDDMVTAYEKWADGTLSVAESKWSGRVSPEYTFPKPGVRLKAFTAASPAPAAAADRKRSWRK